MIDLFIPIWLALLLLAAPYVRVVRHPEHQPLAAYLIFLTVFSVTAYAIFGAVIATAGWAGRAEVLGYPGVAVVILGLMFGPAFWLARRQITKPPRRPPSL